MAGKALANREFESLLDEVRMTDDFEKAKKMLEKVNALEKVLKSMDLFEDQAVKYARLHVEALMRCVDLGGKGALRGNEALCAEWLCGMSEEERSSYIAMCSEGILITQVWKREVKDKNRQTKALEGVKEWKEYAVESLNEFGYVDFRQVSEQIKRSCGAAKLYDHAEAEIDDLRNILRRNGGIGTGSRLGAYVKPNSENKDSVYEAIGNRIVRMIADYKSLRNIVDDSCADLEALKEYHYVDSSGLGTDNSISNHLYDLYYEAKKFAKKVEFQLYCDYENELIEKLNAVGKLCVTADNREEVLALVLNVKEWVEKNTLFA